MAEFYERFFWKSIILYFEEVQHVENVLAESFLFLCILEIFFELFNIDVVIIEFKNCVREKECVLLADKST